VGKILQKIWVSVSRVGLSMNKYISFVMELTGLNKLVSVSNTYSQHIVDYHKEAPEGVDPSSPYGKYLRDKRKHYANLRRDPYMPRPLLLHPSNGYGDSVDGTTYAHRSNSNGGGDCNLGGTVEGGTIPSYTLKINVDDKKLDKVQKKVDRLFGKRPPYGRDTGER